MVAGVDETGNLICELVDGASSISQIIRVLEHIPLETTPGDYELLKAGGFVVIARFLESSAGSKSAKIMVTHESDIFNHSGDLDLYHGSSPGVFQGIHNVSVRFDELDRFQVKVSEHAPIVTVNGEVLVIPLLAASFVDDVFEIGLEVEYIPNLAD